MVNSYLSVSSASSALPGSLTRVTVTAPADEADRKRVVCPSVFLVHGHRSADPSGDSRGGRSRCRGAVDTPWVTIVWDDPVNLMTYVTYVFQKLFGYSEPHATKLMLQVHNEGKAVVSAGSRESMEIDVSKLHAAGLWATHAAGPLRREGAGLTVRKWKRVETADGPRFRSALARARGGDAAQTWSKSMLDMLDDRESSAPADELEEITGIKTGNPRPPAGCDDAPAAA